MGGFFFSLFFTYLKPALNNTGSQMLSFLSQPHCASFKSSKKEWTDRFWNIFQTTLSGSTFLIKWIKKGALEAQELQGSILVLLCNHEKPSQSYSLLEIPLFSIAYCEPQQSNSHLWKPCDYTALLNGNASREADTGKTEAIPFCYQSGIFSSYTQRS